MDVIHLGRAGADRNQIFGAVGHNPAVAGVVVAVEPVHIFHGYAGIFAGLFVRAEEAGFRAGLDGHVGDGHTGSYAHGIHRGTGDLQRFVSCAVGTQVAD